MKKQMGFNLIELLVAVVIVGILASVAYPSYTDYLEQGKVQEATAGLSEGRIRFSQYFQDNRTYTDAENTICPPSTQYFSFTCVTTATTYTLTASGKNSMNGFSYSVDQANVRLSSSTKWGTSGEACWIMRRGGSC